MVGVYINVQVNIYIRRTAYATPLDSFSILITEGPAILHARATMPLLPSRCM